MPGVYKTGRLPEQTLLKGQYLVLDVLGKGGMGAVYLAMDTSTRRRVAVKEMGTSSVTPDRLYEIHTRFEQEANILRRLNHPNLPHFYDYFHDGGRSYIVMDYIEGTTLATLLADNYWRPLPISDVLHYARQLCNVLSYLHTYRDEHGRLNPLVFRDLKPANIIITSQGQVYLIDFGIARFFTDPAHDVMGTLGYSPPEQFYGHTTPRSDLYSLGATLYVSLTGHNPKDNTPNVFNFPPVRNLNPRVPLDVEVLLRWLLATQEADRPESAARVLQELQAIEQRAADVTTELPTNAYGTGIGGLGANFYDDKTARAAQYHAWLIQVNKLPGILGTYWATYIIPALSRSYGAFVGVLLKMYGGKALLNAFSQPVWTPHFWLLFLLSLLFSIGGSMYLVATLHVSSSVVAFYLAGIIALLAFSASMHKDVKRPLSRSILLAMSLLPLLLCAALFTLPTVQHTLQATTLNQLLCVVLVVLGGSMLLRPDERLRWLDHLTLVASATIIVFLQSLLGVQELQQLQPQLDIDQLSQNNTVLIVLAACVGVISMLRPFRPLGRFGRFLVLLLALLDLGLQLALGRTEALPLLQGNIQALRLSPELLYAVLAAGPALLALVLLPLKPSRLGRVPLFVLSCSLAYVQNQVGTSPAFAVSHSYPLTTTLPKLFSFYQLVTYGLVLMACILLLRLWAKFTPIDRIVIFGVAVVTTLLQASVWLGSASAQSIAILGNAIAPLQVNNTTASTSLLIGLNEATAWLLIVVLLTLLAFTILAIFLKLGYHTKMVARSSHNQRLSWVERLATRMDHILILLVVWACVLLQFSFGNKEQVLADPAFIVQKMPITWYEIVLGILGLITLLALFRLRSGFSFWDRLVTICAASFCAFLLFGDLSGVSIALIPPSIPQSTVQILSSLSGFLISAGAFAMVGVSLLWLCNRWQVGDRGLLLLLFGGAWVFALLQLAQPVLLIACLILLLQGLLLATQIEKVR